MNAIPVLYLAILWAVLGLLALVPVLSVVSRIYLGWRNIASMRYLIASLLGIAINQIILIILAFSAIPGLSINRDQFASAGLVLMTIGHVVEIIPLMLFALHTFGVFEPSNRAPGINSQDLTKTQE